MKKREVKADQLEKLLKGRPKKFVRLEEGAQLYSVGKNTFREWAKDAGAIYRIKKVTLVNTEKIEEFLEAFREEDN